MIDADLAQRASGTGHARHAAINKDRAANPNHEEHNAQCKKRGQAGDKLSVATTHYAQDIVDLSNDDDGREIELGSRVSLTNLLSPRSQKLNSTFGFVVDYDSSKQRYRVNLEAGCTGLFKRENLVADPSVPFTDLQHVSLEGQTLGGET